MKDEGSNFTCENFYPRKFQATLSMAFNVNGVFYIVDLNCLL